MKKIITPKNHIPVLDLDFGVVGILSPEWEYQVKDVKVDPIMDRVTFIHFDDDLGIHNHYRTELDYWNVDEEEFVDVE